MTNQSSHNSEKPISSKRFALLVLLLASGLINTISFLRATYGMQGMSSPVQSKARRPQSAKASPTKSAIFQTAQIDPRSQTQIWLAASGPIWACVHHEGNPLPALCLGCDKEMIDELKKQDEAARKKWWPHGYWEDPTYPGQFWREKNRKWCEKFHAHTVALTGL